MFRGTTNYDGDGSKDGDDGSNKVQRRHSDRQSGTTSRERRRNSAPGNGGLKIPRLLSREKSDVSEKNGGTKNGGVEWKTSNNLKLSRGKIICCRNIVFHCLY